MKQSFFEMWYRESIRGRALLKMLLCITHSKDNKLELFMKLLTIAFFTMLVVLHH